MQKSFAAARGPIPKLVSRFECRDLAARAANDNHPGSGRDLLPRDALKHFARHGLGAAEAARGEAERAFFAGDRQSYLHWLNICRTLDRRMAAAISARIEQPVR
ncbi:MAG: hypothetical protein KGM49_02340 [Sphingomonadales bacterium]|nr:hypothetical protein [Sphingomonadales bacterium]